MKMAAGPAVVCLWLLCEPLVLAQTESRFLVQPYRSICRGDSVQSDVLRLDTQNGTASRCRFNARQMGPGTWMPSDRTCYQLRSEMWKDRYVQRILIPPALPPKGSELCKSVLVWEVDDSDGRLNACVLDETPEPGAPSGAIQCWSVPG
jgi:hypothetical protein